MYLFYYRPDRKGHVCQISSSALEAISNCFNLERLTLANLEVDSNNSFLHSVIKFQLSIHYSYLIDFNWFQILAGCRRLKSMRFSNVHHPNSVPIFLVDQLKTGLPLAENLHDFRYELTQY